MSGEPTIRLYQDLPQEIRYFLLDAAVYDQLAPLVEKYHLGDDAVKMLRDIAEEVVFNIYHLPELPGTIQNFLHVDEAAAKDIAVTLAGYRLLPIQEEVQGDVAESIRAWGGDPAAFAGVPRVVVESKTPEFFVEKTLEKLEMEIKEPVMQHRLEYILAGFAKGERDAEKTKEILSRDSKVGGLEFDETTASRVVDLFDERLKAAGVSFRPEDQEAGLKSRPVPPAPAPLPPPVPASEAPGVLPVSRPVLAPQASQPPVAATILLSRQRQAPEPKANFVKDLFGEAEEKEVAVHAQKSDRSALPEGVEGAVRQAVERSGLVFDQSEKRQRFEMIVGSRLRDVRSAYDTRAQLEKPFQSGGLGLSGVTLVTAMQAIEAAFDAFEKTSAAKVMKERQAARERLGQKKQEEETSAPREADILTKRYAELTGSLKAPVLPAVPPPAAKPPRPAPRYSAPTILPAARGGKVEVRDVHFEKRLAGPAEELRRMTLTDFRRLSADPKEAVLKIKDKLDLLEEEGYAQKIQGVKAWRESPLNQQYVALTREALMSAASIADVMGRRRVAREDVMTPGEMEAVISLNSQLRF